MTTEPTATLVVVYSINMDATTGPFLGYGTLTGPSSMVILHPETGSRLPVTEFQQNLRLQIVDDTGDVQVVDGTVYPSLAEDGTELPPAVFPGGNVRAKAARDFWVLPWAERLQLLAADERADPSTSPHPVPEPPKPSGETGVRGPWCKPFPRCPGCR